MKRSFLAILVLCVVIITAACGALLKETQPITSEKRTRELLDIHSSISPQIPFDVNNSKIILFSDLHRGMGTKDVFKNNIELFKQILNYYYANGYTLVIIGDVEEGWGFQADNIPNILDVHGDEFAIEKKFHDENRYYRVYGNHDDFFRGNLIRFGEQFQNRVYPALIFTDQANKFNIFITHGCQGQGLHDAGDQLAAWGVYAKYNWILEIFPKKLKSEKELISKMDAIQKDMEKHEKMVYKWTLEQKNADGKKKYNILVAGHTHIPVFNSIPYDDLLSDMITEDVKNDKYIFFNDIFEKKLSSQNDDLQEGEDSLKLPDSLKEHMLNNLKIKKNRTLADNANSLDPFYFNTGCGFHTKISCIEISGGKIYLRLLFFDGEQKINFENVVQAAELKNYE